MRYRIRFLLYLTFLLASVFPAQAQTGQANWIGDYFNNSFLSAPSAFTRQDGVVAFDWGLGSPGANVGTDNFSVRWGTDIYLPQGTYRFWALADDNVRVTVDFSYQPLIDTFANPQVGQIVSGDITLNAGTHHIQVDYRELTGTAFVYVSWANLASNPTGPNFPTTGQPPTTGSVTISPWTAQYYNNRFLNGAPVLIQSETTPNHNWGTASPAPAVSADNFSARWTAQPTLSGGTYRIAVRADDGVRVYVNGVAVINEWHGATSQTYTADVTLVSGGNNFMIEYYEEAGDAFLEFSLAQTGFVPQPPVLPPGGGFPQPQPGSLWTAQYYNNTGLIGQPVFTLTEPTPAHNWGAGAPVPGLPADNFSVRWTSQQNLSAGTYRFTVQADDGVRIYVDGVLVINEWHNATAQVYTATVNLSMGIHNFVVEYYEAGGVAFLNYTFEPVSANVPVGVLQPGNISGNWIAYYYNGTSPSGTPVAILTEPTPSHNWGGGSPIASVSPDNFSARWTSVQTVNAGTYRFTVQADDGVRIYVDNRLVIDQWRTATGQTYTADVTLSAGPHTFTVEYFEAGGVAFLDYNFGLATPTTPTPPLGQGGGGVAQPQYTGASAVVGIYRVNVRNLPTTSGSSIIAKINPGETYPIVGRTEDSSWWQIEVNGQFGWVFARFLDVSNTGRVPLTFRAETVQPQATGFRAAALTNVIIRSGPGTGSAVLGNLRAGQSASIIGRTRDARWWQINLNGVIGWVIAAGTTVPGGADLSRIPVTG